MDNELSKRIQDFLWAFELVFDNDWDYTKLSILDEYLISDKGTFINPFPGEHFTGGEGDNWANRSALSTTASPHTAIAWHRSRLP